MLSLKAIKIRKKVRKIKSQDEAPSIERDDNVSISPTMIDMEEEEREYPYLGLTKVHVSRDPTAR